MLKPEALNENWGGVICLNLDATAPADFTAIRELLVKTISSDKHYLISVYDVPNALHLGDCEAVQDISGNIVLQQIRLRNASIIDLFRYYFNQDGTYLRSINAISIVTTPTTTA